MGIKIDFNVLLEPYKEGGSLNSPTERTIGTIIDYLIHKKKYPLEIVGSAILEVFLLLAHDKVVFRGDGSYGSKGRELVTAIRIVCDRKLQGRLEDQVMQDIIEQKICTVVKCRKRSISFRKKRMFDRFRKKKSESS